MWLRGKLAKKKKYEAFVIMGKAGGRNVDVSAVELWERRRFWDVS